MQHKLNTMQATAQHTYTQQAAKAQQRTAQYAALAAATALSCSTQVAQLTNSEDHCYSFVYNAVISALFNASVLCYEDSIAEASVDVAYCVSDYYEASVRKAVYAIVHTNVTAALMQHCIVKKL